MLRKMILRATMAFILCGLFTAGAYPQSAPPFDASALVKLGDNVKYGSYIIYKIGDGIYEINDPGDKTTGGRGHGVDMYLICGTRKALLVDLGNDYIDGYAQDHILPRKNAAEELRAVVYGLAGKVQLEIAITHAHPDHDGMTGAFVNRNVTIWMPEGEDFNAPKVDHKIDPKVYTPFAPDREFDLGGARIVKPILVRGHTNGSTVYLLTNDMYLFTGDALGSGFGQAFPTVPILKVFAEDSQDLVEYIKANFTPYARYSLKVFTGHSWQNVFAGWWSQNHDLVDVGYLDWRFVQNEASCASGILKGKWLVEGSGLQIMGKLSPESWLGEGEKAIMVYGIGSIIIPLKTAYDAAGLPMPQ